MAETTTTNNNAKRQSIGGKIPVATPNIGIGGPPGTVNLETALCGAIGARVRLTTTLQHTIEGTVYTASPLLNILALTTSTTPSATTSGTPPSTSYRIISISSIQSFTLLPATSPPPTSFSTAQPALQPLDTNALQSRLDTAVARLKAEDARRGKGVGKEAQDIFDALSRTLPCRWADMSIIVNDQVIIERPYGVGDCKAGHGTKADVLGRVKKVLEIERKKLAEKTQTQTQTQNKPAVPNVAPTGGPRKGG